MNTFSVTTADTTRTRTATRRTTTAPRTTDTPGHHDDGDDPFFRRYGTRRLPRGLREEAAGMDWQLFLTIYSPEARLAVNHVTSTRRDNCTYRFGISATRRSKTHAPREEFHEIDASGPAAACSQLLADAGRAVEILDFHQYPLFEATVTFVRGSWNNRTAWAMGFGPDPQTSVVHALTCAAERIHG
ncbi:MULTISPECIES: acetyl-CoA acetyltransferase [Corynebacterium]|uniref:acetyl-CoA acetyltransferase n=1 Tax=Corynebacterium TaxID=1716 RepID=UPI00254C6E2F|nr:MULTISPECIES: acetyl-CoA acetyltransferase [Corynebacterium]MDK8895217.1 acetyl-CoA acetyltransferase [Corynebacterium sp. MSK006]